MADTSFAITAGSGTPIHSVTTSIGGTTVHDQVWKAGEPFLATYSIGTSGWSIATAASHTLQIMAGASLNVYLRRLQIWQLALATTAAIVQWDIWRLSTAGTGGTSLTPAPNDTTDAASGATAMVLPTAKGTESTRLWSCTSQLIQTVGTGVGGNTLLVDARWDNPRSKAIRIPAGTSNGIAIKQFTGAAAATVALVLEFSEANF